MDEKDKFERKLREAETACTQEKENKELVAEKCKSDLKKWRQHWALKCSGLEQKVDKLEQNLSEKENQLEDWQKRFKELDTKNEKDQFNNRESKRKVTLITITMKSCVYTVQRRAIIFYELFP